MAHNAQHNQHPARNQGNPRCVRGARQAHSLPPRHMRHARRLRGVRPRHNGRGRDGHDLRGVDTLGAVGRGRRRDVRRRVLRARKAALPPLHGGRDRLAHRAQPPRARGKALDRRRARRGGGHRLFVAPNGRDHEGRDQGRRQGLAAQGVHRAHHQASPYRRGDRARHPRRALRRIPQGDAAPRDARACPVRGGGQHLRLVPQGLARRPGRASRHSAHG